MVQMLFTVHFIYTPIWCHIWRPNQIVFFTYDEIHLWMIELPNESCISDANCCTYFKMSDAWWFYFMIFLNATFCFIHIVVRDFSWNDIGAKTSAMSLLAAKDSLMARLYRECCGTMSLKWYKRMTSVINTSMGAYFISRELFMPTKINWQWFHNLSVLVTYQTLIMTTTSHWGYFHVAFWGRPSIRTPCY